MRTFAKICLSAAVGLAGEVSAVELPGGCDYLIVTAAPLVSQAERLAAFRAGFTGDDVAKPAVVTMADIYRDHPRTGQKYTSLLAFLQSLDSLQRLPKYLVLFGDASADSTSSHDLVPTRVIQQSLHSPGGPTTPASEDEAFAALNDSLSPYEKDIRMRLAAGRIPASTVAQAQAYVDKVIAHESDYPYGPRSFAYGMVSDDDVQWGNLAPIERMPDFLRTIWDSLPQKPFLRTLPTLEVRAESDTSNPRGRDSLISLFASGMSTLYISVLGNEKWLADERLFTVPQDLDRLRPTRRAPVTALISGPTCGFIRDSLFSFGEGILFHPHGALAVLGHAHSGYTIPSLALYRRWEKLLAGQGPVTLGESFRLAKDSVSAGMAFGNAAGHILLGDPGLVLRRPLLDVSPAPSSHGGGLSLAGGKAGDSLYYQVVRVDSIPYAGLARPDNSDLNALKFPREVLLSQGYEALDAQGGASIPLPLPVQERTWVKVMIWNPQSMRYGMISIESLGPAGIREAASRRAAAGKPILLLDGSAYRAIRGKDKWTLLGRAAEAFRRF